MVSPRKVSTSGAPRIHPRSEMTGTLRKADAILEALRTGASSPADIAIAIGQPRSSVYRLLATMEGLGWVRREPGSGRMLLGFRHLALADAARSGLDIRTAALPVMKHVHAVTGETVFLCVRSGDVAVCIERIEGKRVALHALKVGGTLPLHAGAAPQALLAFEEESEWDSYLDGVPAEAFATEIPADSAAAARQRLATARLTGLAVSDGDVTPGVAAIGAPIFDESGEVCAALSVSGIREGLLGTGSVVSQEVLKGAEEISRALGAWTEPVTRSNSRNED